MLAGIASIKMATVSQYFEALERSVTEEGHRFPVLKDDLFPCNTNWLSDGGVKFWTGFYSSREVCMRSIVHICVCECDLFTCLVRLFRFVLVMHALARFDDFGLACLSISRTSEHQVRRLSSISPAAVRRDHAGGYPPLH